MDSIVNSQAAPALPDAQERFLGLAALLRLNFSGVDLTPLGQALIARASVDTNSVDALMDAATILQFKGNTEVALTIQQEALQVRQHFRLPAATQPAGLRVLALMAPGDLMANVPLECLLEHSDADLDLYYLLPEGSRDPIPEHDVLFVALSETEDNKPLLDDLPEALKDWPRPVVNRPDRIRRVARDRASRLLADVPEIAMPPTLRVERSTLQQIAETGSPMEALLPGFAFPIIVRPLDSHAGHDLQRVENAAELAAYLAAVSDAAFYVSPFIDYRSGDGLFRKFRIVLVEGKPFACHMGISSHWMIHYLNAGMDESAAKRAEEERFMSRFDEDFAQRHGAALREVYERMGLEYVCIDCAELDDGRLLIFEVDHAMVVHALDPVAIYPYKRPQMQKIFQAFRDMLGRRAAAEPGIRE